MDVTHCMHSGRIEPSEVRYIKLGPGGSWFDHARTHDLIELGHAAITHDLALGANEEKLRQEFATASGATPANITAFTNEMLTFVTAPETTLWITFERGLMWWAFAAPELIELSPSGHNGARARRLLAPWRADDVAGAPLRMEELSGRLTRVAAYRKSICRVSADEYAIRRINAEPSALAQRAAQAQDLMRAIAIEMIRDLDPLDFEILIDLIFAHSGWRRVGALGGTQADTDLILVQQATGERAFVQVKSTADAQVFAASDKLFRESRGFARMFFACHTPDGEWPAPRQDVVVWSGDALAAQALDAGLFGWLSARAQ